MINRCLTFKQQENAQHAIKKSRLYNVVSLLLNYNATKKKENT